MPNHFRPPYLAALQLTLADNVRVLMDSQLSAFHSEDDRVKDLERRSGVGKSTIYRILKPDQYAAKSGTYSYPGLDKVARLARALEVSAAQLLTPDFAAGRVGAGQPKRRSSRRTAA